MFPRLAYRSRQFWNALLDSHDRIPEGEILPYLTPAQLSLFRRMQPPEQHHAYALFRSLQAAGQTDPDLLTAALLHDVGKTLYPLSIWERVVVVVGKRLLPGSARHWGEGEPRGLLKPFVVAEHHAEWGADLASRAGAAARTVELIRHHHEKPFQTPGSEPDTLLAALQLADGEN